MLKRFFIYSYRQCHPIKLCNQYCLFSSGKPMDPEVEQLLNLANEFMSAGKIRTAEDVYKKLIEKYPNVEEPYQRLWNSWQAHRYLKVTQKEMDTFIEKYEKYIKLKPEDIKRP